MGDTPLIRLLASMPDPYPERRRPEYCWRSWPPVHTDGCGCLQDPAWRACFPEYAEANEHD